MRRAVINEIVDASGPCGFAYFKGLATLEDREGMDSSCGAATFAQAAIVFPRGATALEIGGPTAPLSVSASQLAVLPPRYVHSIRGKSSIIDVFVMLPSESVFEDAAEAHGLSPDTLGELLEAPRVLPRSVWINELQHRYFFERLVCKKRDNLTTDFLQRELAKEIYYRFKNASSSTTCAPVMFETDTLGKRAIAYVEKNLFESTLSIAGLASHVRASRSTLERAFKDEVQRSPNEYIRDRRLDEARALIVAGRLPVGHVASLVGYQNFSAFSQAFKRRFAVSPSQMLAIEQV
jgi:AraC-like DNA-binding protein